MANNKVKFKRKDGVIAFPRVVIKSPAYKDLSAKARALMFELQNIWSPWKSDLHLSIRRAAKMLNVSKNTANIAFKELEAHGFVACVGEYDWSNGQARVWRLSWVNNNGREPTDEWMKWVK